MKVSLCSGLKISINFDKLTMIPSLTSLLSAISLNKMGRRSDSASSGPIILAISWILKASVLLTLNRESFERVSYRGLIFGQAETPKMYITAGIL